MSRLGRFAPDRGLVVRMVATMGGLALLYFAATAFLVTRGVPVLTVVVVVAGFGLFQWYASDRIALFALNARVVTPEEAPELHGVIDRLCALAGTPKPRVAIADTDVPNAFATGRSPAKAVVCATTGLLRRLEPDEIEGVMAHELAHVAHRDVAVMTLASFLGVLAGLVTRFALHASFYGAGFGERRRGSSKDNGAPFVLVVIVVAAGVYAVSYVLIRTLSRYRELSADRSGALLTGRPSSLASALTKLGGEMARVPTRDLRQQEPFNAFFVIPALAPGFTLSSLFSTHPTLEKRVERLARLSRELA